MTDHFLFTQPRFTARAVAHVLGRMLGRELASHEADEWEGVDGEVTVTGRVSVQVGADYLVVSAWVDDMTLRSWRARRSIEEAVIDLKDALAQSAGLHNRCMPFEKTTKEGE